MYFIYLRWFKSELVLIFLLVFLTPNRVSAQDNSTLSDINSNTQIVEYDAGFFTRYSPNTALDMVSQLPGFQLDDGDGSRGFATSAGNLLINGRRLSAKQDLPSAMLSRIPASLVERIEIIRGQTGEIDLQGHSVLANVYLREDSSSTVRWELWIQQNYVAPIKPAGNASLSSNWGDIDYNLGIDVERDTSGWQGTESHFDANGNLVAIGPDDRTETGFRVNSLSLNASTWAGDNFIQFNSRATGNNSNYQFPTSLTSQLPGGGTVDEFRETDSIIREYEIGTDIERQLSPDINAKAILLFIDTKRTEDSSRRITDSILGQTLFRLADTRTFTNELIARTEFDWLGLDNHIVQLNIERAENVLNRSLLQTDDRGMGPVEVSIPGGNSRVKEVRWDFLLQDTWSLLYLKLEYGLGAEASTLLQTGDAVQERDFFFLKPHVSLNYSLENGKLIQLRLAREVSQLDLDDFVTATVFEDDDLALGNPDIKPDTTWIAELIYEQRFGEVGVFKLRGFHHWIRDVLDLLPLSDDFEAPGNIGNGRRWGMELEATLPLTWVNLKTARLDLNAIWYDTTVIDPVTGLSRRLSGIGGQGGYQTLKTRNENIEYYFRIDFRQDFQTERFAWGWTLADRGDRPLYKVNELDIHNDGTALDIFIETTRWIGIKTRFQIENALDFNRKRDRILYSGRREISPLDTTIVVDRSTGRRFTLFINGSF